MRSIHCAPFFVSCLISVAAPAAPPPADERLTAERFQAVLQSQDLQEKRRYVGWLLANPQFDIPDLRQPLLNLLNDSSADAAVRLSALLVLRTNPSVSRDDDTFETHFPFVLESLHNNDSDARSLAAAVLGTFGQRSGPEIAKLVNRLTQSDEQEWKSAARLLAAVGAAAAEPLGKVLDDPRTPHAIKLRILDAFHRMSEEGPEWDKPHKARAALPILESVIDDSDPELMLRASLAIDELDRNALRSSEAGRAALPAYVRLLETDDMNTAAMALTAIGAMGDRGAHAIPDIIEFAKRLREIEHRERRAWAGIGIAGAVFRIGPAALPKLADALRSDDPHTRCLAATLMNNFTGERVREEMQVEIELPDSAVPALLDMLRSEDQRLRTCAIPLLGAYGARAKEAVPLLLDMIDADRLHRLAREGHWKALSGELSDLQRIAESLEEIDRQTWYQSEEARSLINPLRGALRREPDPAGNAMQLLRHLGPTAARAVPDLLAKIAWVRARDDEGLPTSVVMVIDRIGDAAVARTIEVLHDHDDPAVRRAAAYALWMIESAAPDAIPALQRAASADPDQAVREEARNALGIIHRRAEWLTKNRSGTRPAHRSISPASAQQ